MQVVPNQTSKTEPQYTSSVSPKGQITLPLEIRHRLGVKPRDRVAVTLEGDVVKVRRLGSPVDATYQAVPALTPPRSWKEIERTAHEDAADAAVRDGLEP
ncbi:MAG: AbrB/MazE/SpoVT family DNA-binding domain-containing protein [Chloroflexota bacterium]